jgi:ABC-type arginine transport system permease subunit
VGIIVGIIATMNAAGWPPLQGGVAYNLSAAATLTWVILPQAARNALPDLVSSTIADVDRRRRVVSRTALCGGHGAR